MLVINSFIHVHCLKQTFLIYTSKFIFLKSYCKYFSHVFNFSFWNYFYPASKYFESTVHWKALVVQLCCRTAISLSIIRLHKYLCWWMLYSFQTSLLVALFLLMNWKQNIFKTHHIQYSLNSNQIHLSGIMYLPIILHYIFSSMFQLWLSHHQRDTVQGIVHGIWVFILIREWNSCTLHVNILW